MIALLSMTPIYWKFSAPDLQPPKQELISSVDNIVYYLNHSFCQYDQIHVSLSFYCICPTNTTFRPTYPSTFSAPHRWAMIQEERNNTIACTGVCIFYDLTCGSTLSWALSLTWKSYYVSLNRSHSHFLQWLFKTCFYFT